MSLIKLTEPSLPLKKSRFYWIIPFIAGFADFYYWYGFFQYGYFDWPAGNWSYYLWVGIGISSYIAPLYISEISLPYRRGALVSLNQLAHYDRYFLSYVVDYYFVPDSAWCSMFEAGIIPATLLLIGMLGLPYSPQWILSQNRDEKHYGFCKNSVGAGPEAKRELKQIRTTLQQQKGSWKALFSKIIQPTLIVGAGLAIFQQVTRGIQYQYYSLLRS